MDALIAETIAAGPRMYAAAYARANELLMKYVALAAFRGAGALFTPTHHCGGGVAAGVRVAAGPDDSVYRRDAGGFDEWVAIGYPQRRRLAIARDLPRGEGLSHFSVTFGPQKIQHAYIRQISKNVATEISCAIGNNSITCTNLESGDKIASGALTLDYAAARIILSVCDSLAASLSAGAGPRTLAGAAWLSSRRAAPAPRGHVWAVVARARMQAVAIVGISAGFESASALGRRVWETREGVDAVWAVKCPLEQLQDTCNFLAYNSPVGPDAVEIPPPGRK